MTVRETMDEIELARRTAVAMAKWSQELDEQREQTVLNTERMLYSYVAILEKMEVKMS